MSSSVIISDNDKDHAKLLAALELKGVDVTVSPSLENILLEDTRYLFIFHSNEHVDNYKGKLVYVYEDLTDEMIQDLFTQLFSYSFGKTITLGTYHEKPPLPTPPVSPKTKRSRVKLPKLDVKFNKKYLVGAIAILWIMLSPFIILFISAATSYLSLKSIESSHFKSARILLLSSKAFSGFSRSQFKLLSHLPLLKNEGDIGYETSAIVYETSDLGIKSLDLIPQLKKLMSHVLTQDNYDIQKLSEELSLSFDDLYKEASFLESEIETLNLNPFVDEQLLTTMATTREYLYALSVITAELPSALGVGTEKNYLILFQNSMELRPTGGFIGSFAIVSFTNGKLGSSKVYDVYDADGQLQGYIKPPDPIVNYLDEASWHLRDSNWDPDFSVSASRAIWFLDKSLDVSVDGVVAVNLQVAQSILDITGPIEIIDYGDELTSQNMYEVVQKQVHQDFFPGSHKKKNYLTAFQTSLFNRLKSVNQKEAAQIAAITLNHVKSRDIQIFSNNNNIQDVSNVLGWSGEDLSLPTTCGENCMNNWFSIIEANLGVNKANYYISREAKYFSVVEGTKITNRVVYKIKNNAPNNLNSADTRYKNFIRLITNENADIFPVGVFTPDVIETRTAQITSYNNKKEAGILVDIPAGEEWSIVYEWSTKHDLSLLKSGQIRYLWRKQSGVAGFPIQLRLTYKGDFSYNSKLDQDFKKNIKL